MANIFSEVFVFFNFFINIIVCSAIRNAFFNELPNSYSI